MAKRVVKAALWEYRDRKGRRRRAFFGDEVNLTESEIERGDRENVFTPAPPRPVEASALEKALAGIETRVDEPVLLGEQGEVATRGLQRCRHAVDQRLQGAGVELTRRGDLVEVARPQVA